MISVPMDGFGGGAPLNFAVKTYTTKEELLAATPKENTIGLITSIPMAGYMFSVDRPDTSEVGVVWLEVGTASSVAFNATKRNPIRVYPLSAKILNDSLAWESVEALTYINGSWTYWATYLYNNGDERDEFTGGWSKHYVSSPYYASGTLTKNDTYMTISCRGISGLHVATGLIDLSSYEKLTVVVDGISINQPAVSCVQILPSGFGWAHEGFTPVASTAINANGSFEIDVSNLSGSYYVGFQIRCTVSSQYCSYNIREVYLQ